MAQDAKLLALAQAIGTDIKTLNAAIAGKTTTAYVDAAVANLRSTLLNGADAAHDTFRELQDLMVADETTAAALATAVGFRVRFDAAQTLTAAQMLQACQNIGVGNYDQDLVAAYTAAKA